MFCFLKSRFGCFDDKTVTKTGFKLFSAPEGIRHHNCLFKDAVKVFLSTPNCDRLGHLRWEVPQNSIEPSRAAAIKLCVSNNYNKGLGHAFWHQYDFMKRIPFSEFHGFIDQIQSFNKNVLLPLRIFKKYDRIMHFRQLSRNADGIFWHFFYMDKFLAKEYLKPDSRPYFIFSVKFREKSFFIIQVVDFFLGYFEA